MFCISGQSLESLGTIPLTFDSLQRSTLYILQYDKLLICLFMNNSGVQVTATVWLHACSSQQLWPGEIFQEESKLRSLWLLKALICIVHNILLSAFFLCTNYCRTQRLLYMTEILMCEGAVNKCILEKKNSSWMQVLRDPNINGTYTETHMLKISLIH